MDALGALLSSQVKAKIVCRLFSVGAQPIHLRELARTIDCNFSAVQREAKRLSGLGILVAAKVGLVRKSEGSIEILRQAIGKKGIDVAFVFGSVAAETERIESDVDVMIIGEIGLREIVKRLTGVSARIGREINPHVMKAIEFSKRKMNRDHFVSCIWKQPKQFLVGSEDDLN